MRGCRHPRGRRRTSNRRPACVIAEAEHESHTRHWHRGNRVKRHGPSCAQWKRQCRRRRHLRLQHRALVARRSSTQVGIVGAGPAGLMLAQLLHLNGIDSVVVENRSRDYVIDRVRAGVLEQGTVDLLVAMGVGAGVRRGGLPHSGVDISFQGRRHRIDLTGLTGGKGITVYGQNEVVRDLIDARIATGRPLYFEAEDVTVAGIDATPTIRFRHDDDDHELVCDFIAGCDGFHGICRPAIPADVLTVFERTYPFGWLGILAEAAPSSEELVYTYHDRGFALFSMRSPTITRLYFQVPPEERIDDWSDAAIWEEMLGRMRTCDGWQPHVGRILQKSVTPMRSFVAAPMQYGRVFLAGDAAYRAA